MGGGGECYSGFFSRIMCKISEQYNIDKIVGVGGPLFCLYKKSIDNMCVFVLLPDDCAFWRNFRALQTIFRGEQGSGARFSGGFCRICSAAAMDLPHGGGVGPPAGEIFSFQRTFFPVPRPRWRCRLPLDAHSAFLLLFIHCLLKKTILIKIIYPLFGNPLQFALRQAVASEIKFFFRRLVVQFFRVQ